jgi:hypothetical protein
MYLEINKMEKININVNIIKTQIYVVSIHLKALN